MHVLILFSLIYLVKVNGSNNTNVDKCNSLQNQVSKLTETVELLSRQVMLQQFFTEEKIRNDGFSGIKQIRTEQGGSKNYFSNTFSGSSFAAMHDHANNIRTVGLGEFIAVLNGVEFRTRHNDYRLNQPHSTSRSFHKVEPIEFPDVPPEVLSKPNMSSQIKEMREWFKAWKTSNHTVRDYRKYFQPVLCYLEGAWTRSRKDNRLEEPFESDRHAIDARSWFELQEKVKYTSYSGTKSLSENLAFLPTTIMRLKKKTSMPMFAQWNYRIVCHKLKTPIPLTKLRPLDDLASRMSRSQTMQDYGESRAARFELDLDLNPYTAKFRDHQTKNDFLDKLMEEIPGKDNYQGRIYDGGFDSDVMNMDGKTKKDVSRYHRWFKLKKKDAMGKTESHRGYADQFLFVAKTKQKKVASMKLENCEKDTETKKRNCNVRQDRYSYAIPLEIIYLTPLTKWNPLGISINKNCKAEQTNKTDARIGKGLCKDMKKAKTYACPRFYYITPDEFFSGEEVDVDPADTAHSGGWCMLDKNNKGVVARSSGTRIFFPNIPGVGKLRQRFPIAPIHGEGSVIWKNLNALTDIVMNKDLDDYMRAGKPTVSLDKSVTFQLAMSTGESRKPPHAHFFTLFQSNIKELMEGKTVVIETNARQEHHHKIEVIYNTDKGQFLYTLCDDLTTCYDLHPHVLIKVT